jgi:hypothetical protein
VARLESERGSAEILLVARSPDAAIAHRANSAAGGALRTVSLNDDDPVALWRAGTKQASGRFMAFVEAGDMWSSNWLVDSLRAARRERRRLSVWRPEMVLGAGRNYFTMNDLHASLQPPMADVAEGAALMLIDPYAPTFLAHRDVLDTVELPRPDPARGWGHSRAWWTANALAAGFAQRIVEGTALYRWDQPKADPEPVRFGPIPLAEVADHEIAGQ